VGDTVGALAFWLAMGGIGVAFFLGPIGQAFARRISGAKADPATGLTTGEMNAERVAAMEERLLQLEHQRNQLDERVDFAERMLTKERGETPGLAAGDPQ
jgi:hypothetical protein